MSNDLNQCQFIGRVGQDPDIRFTQSGDAVANLSLAVGSKYKSNGQVVEETEWVRVVAFKRLADVIKDYVKKGSRLFVSGELKTRKWQDQSGQDRYATEVVLRNMQMLDSRQQTGQPAPNQGYQQPQQGYQQQPAQQPAPVDDFDSDIPF